MKRIRIGSGSGYAGDRIEPALELIKDGQLDYIIFECLAERTIALAQRERSKDSNKGYNSLLEYRMTQVIPLLKEHPVKIVTNMGAANPIQAATITKSICESHDLHHLKIAYVLGDDIFDKLPQYHALKTIESGVSLENLDKHVISANAYIGAKSIVDALAQGADIVITGRASDPSLTVAPLMYEFSKSFTDFDFLAKASVAGHLLECGAQVTGGYYANPNQKPVERLWEIGFPIIEFSEDGNFTIEKLPDSGGLLTPETVTEQLVYEIHDPENYLTPDVVVDFSKIKLRVCGDKIAVHQITGKPATGLLKVSVGYEDGFLAEGEISYGGHDCVKLADLASDLIAHRMQMVGIQYEDIRTDYIGINSLYGQPITDFKGEVREVRLRKAIRTNQEEDAKNFCFEMSSLYTNGPAAGGGIRTRLSDIVAIESILVPVEDVPTIFKLI